MRFPDALKEAKELTATDDLAMDGSEISQSHLEGRIEKLERRLGRMVDDEFEEFLATQEWSRCTTAGSTRSASGTCSSSLGTATRSPSSSGSGRSRTSRGRSGTATA